MEAVLEVAPAVIGKVVQGHESGLAQDIGQVQGGGPALHGRENHVPAVPDNEEVSGLGEDPVYKADPQGVGAGLLHELRGGIFVVGLGKLAVNEGFDLGPGHLRGELITWEISVAVPPDVVDLVAGPGAETWKGCQAVSEKVGSGTAGADNDKRYICHYTSIPSSRYT